MTAFTLDAAPAADNLLRYLCARHPALMAVLCDDAVTTTEDLPGDVRAAAARYQRTAVRYARTLDGAVHGLATGVNGTAS